MKIPMGHGAKRVLLAMAAAMACASTQAAGDPTWFGVDVAPTAGGSFWLSWLDDAVPEDTGFSDTSVVVAYDASVLTLTAAAAGQAFGVAALGQVDGYWDLEIAGVPYANSLFSLSRVEGLAAYPTDLLHLQFDVKPGTQGQLTSIYFFNPEPGLVMNGYYSFVDTGTAIQVAVPEPATVASMLAGLGLLAGLGVARKRRTPQAA